MGQAGMHLNTLWFGHKFETTNVAAARHALLVIDLAIGERGQQRQVELAYLRVLEGEIMKNAVIRIDRGHAVNDRGALRVISKLFHDLGKLLDLLRLVSQPRMLTSQLLSDC